MKKYILALIILAVLVDVFLFFKHKPEQKNLSETNKNQAQDILLALTGEKVSETEAKTRPIAVMVENFPAARPQSGLAYADLVFEAPTEAGITRFLAVYQTTEPKSIGPVRSARVYFAEFADQLGALFAHVGGNSDALANIKQGEYKNLADADQFFNDPYFERVTWREMPHNVYTSIEKLKGLISHKKYSAQATFSPWKFNSDLKPSTSTINSILVNFSPKEYAVEWKYDLYENSYLRYLAGQPHKDKDGTQIKAQNIAVMFVKTFPTKTDTLYSIGMNLEDGGKALGFFNGTSIEGLWKKQDGRIRFFTAQNQEIAFAPGKTWVEVVPIELTVTFK